MTPPTDTLASLGRLVGMVKVEIGPRVFELPVKSVALSRDRGEAAGGFFDDGHGSIGILVAADATPEEAEAQIKHAAEDAVSHLTRQFVN